MAPEQLSGDALDRRADIFSVGCILWSFATGRRLWENLSDVQVMRRLWDGEIPSPTSVNPKCDPEFARIIQKAMAADADERYATALELQADLEKFAESLGAPVKQKEIGATVAELFKQKREELKQLIEAQLKRIDSDEYSAAGFPIIGIPEANPSASQLTAPRTPPPRRWFPLAAVLVTAGGLAAVVGAKQLMPGPPPPPQVIVQQAPAPSPKDKAPPPVEEKVLELATVRFSVTPSNAQLFFDDVPLAPGSQSKVVPMDGAIHVVRGEAEGYRTASVEFAATADNTVELTLEKEASAAPARVRFVPRRRAPQTKPAAEEPAPPKVEEPRAPNCSNPFYIDSAGIKRVRAECR